MSLEMRVAMLGARTTWPLRNLSGHIILSAGSVSGIERSDAEPALLTRCVDDGIRVLLLGQSKTRATSAHSELVEGRRRFCERSDWVWNEYQILPICARILLPSCGSTDPVPLVSLVVVCLR